MPLYVAITTVNVVRRQSLHCIGVQMNQSITQYDKPHNTIYIFCILCIATVFALHFSAISFPYEDWIDTYLYHGAARSIITQGEFISHTNYESLAQIKNPELTKQILNYPNYGFQLSIALMSLLRGEFDMLNGVLISCIFTLLLVFASYYCILYATKKRALSIIFSMFLIFHPSVLEILARPLAESGLLFFFVVSILLSLRNHIFFAGAILGLGYFYREHALMFLPFISILSPKCTSIKTYIKTAVVALVGFLPFYALRYAGKAIYAQGGGDFYSEAYSQWFFQWLTWDALTTFFENVLIYAHHLGWVICIFLAVCIVFWKKIPTSSRKCIFVGICISLIPCVMWSARSYIPIRYQIYSIFLFYLAGAMLISSIKGKKIQTGFTLAFIIGTLCFRMSPAINSNSIEALLNPSDVYGKYYAHIRKPAIINNTLPPHSVILTNHMSSAYLAFPSPEIVQLPSYETFLKGKDNNKIDAIIIAKEQQSDWPKSKEIIDNAGMTFYLTHHITLSKKYDIELYVYAKNKPNT